MILHLVAWIGSLGVQQQPGIKRCRYKEKKLCSLYGGNFQSGEGSIGFPSYCMSLWAFTFPHAHHARGLSFSGAGKSQSCSFNKPRTFHGWRQDVFWRRAHIRCQSWLAQWTFWQLAVPLSSTKKRSSLQYMALCLGLRRLVHVGACYWLRLHSTKATNMAYRTFPSSVTFLAAKRCTQ